MRKPLTTLFIVLAFLLANTPLMAQAESLDKAVFGLDAGEVCLGRDSVQSAAIQLSVEDEVYVAIVLSPSTVNRLNGLISESETRQLTLSVGEQKLLGPLAIHVDQMPSELRVGTDNIDDAYRLLRALNR